MEIMIGKHDFYHRQQEIVNWCIKNFGTRGSTLYFSKYPERWAYEIFFGNGIFKFKTNADAMLFKLCWGGTVSPENHMGS